MAKQNIDITCLAAFHAEGDLAYRTLRSLRASAEAAAEQGIGVEILAVLDRPTAETLAFFSRTDLGKLRPDNIVRCDFGDAGLTRNFGVTHANGKYIFIMDGDDLVSRNWFTECFKTNERLGPDFILHSEWNLTFGRQWTAWRQWGMDSPHCYIPNYIFHNYWSALSFAHRSVFERVPYVFADHAKGFGYEDMHWNCETVARGFQHRSVPGTIHFVRLKETESRNLMHILKRTVVLPSLLFNKETYLKFADETIVQSTNVRKAQAHEYFSKFRSALRNLVSESFRLFTDEGSVSKRIFRFVVIVGRCLYLVLVRPLFFLLPRHVEDYFRRYMHKALKRLPAARTPLKFPASVISQISEISEIEPELLPSKEMMARIYIAEPLPKETFVLQYYLRLMKEWGDEKPSDLILVGEREIPRLKDYVTHRGLGHRVVCLVLGAVDPQTIQALLPQAKVFVFPYAREFSDRMLTLICRISLQLQPQRLHALSGELLTDFIKYYSLPISQTSEVYYVAQTEVDGDTERSTLNCIYLRRANLKAVYTTEPSWVRKIVQLYGLSPDLFICYGPSSSAAPQLAQVTVPS